MPKENILVVEDDEDILELLRYNLNREGYKVNCVATGEEAIKAAVEEAPELILLDIMLPGADGYEVCRRLKSRPETGRIPIIMLTAKGEDIDIVTGLELGADDYIPKPFSPKVLIARIRTVLRRKTAEPVDESDVIKRGGIVIHPGRHEVRIGSEKVELTSTEFKILHSLASRPGWVFTRYQIVDAVHGRDYPVLERSIDVQIASLRKKLGKPGRCIKTVRGVGYKFSEQDE